MKKKADLIADLAQCGDGDTFYCTVCAARGSNGRKLRKLAEACSGQVAGGSMNSLNLLKAGVKHKAGAKLETAKEKRLPSWGKAWRAAYNKAYYDTHKASLSVAAKKKRAEAKRAEQFLQSFRDILSTQGSDFDKLG